MRYLREFDSREVMLRSNTYTWFHLAIQITIPKIVEIEWNGKWCKTDVL